ncbi:MAG: alanine racemase [Proteobacteria bacterium]|nr:alanine racemase [Pseudomonadota bacterium]
MKQNKKLTRPYSKPSMVKLGGPLYAKHGAASNNSVPVRTSISKVPVSELAQKYGSPLFVFSEDAIRNAFTNYTEVFKRFYPKMVFGWSYKTNYLKAICAIFHEEGAIAEVVSDFEYEKARALGVPGDQIIFNGPYKPKAALKRAIEEGAVIHVDSMDEIYQIEAIATEIKLTARVGLRVNMNTGVYPQWSRFGLNIESGQAMDAARRLAKAPGIEFEGIHCHIGTFMLSVQAYEIAAEKMANLFLEIESDTGVRLKYIDMGGGFPSKSHLKGVYQSPEVAVPNISEYAIAITSCLKRIFADSELPTLVLEAGRHLIDEAGFLITSVISRKLLPDARRAYVLDAGVNLLYTSTWYRPVFELDGDEGSFLEPAVLFGPLCMNIDVIDNSLMLPPLRVGKRLVLSPVGAYNVTQWMQFIQYRPAVVLVRKNGKVDLIRHKENLEAVENLEVLPEDLQQKQATVLGFKSRNVS